MDYELSDKSTKQCHKLCSPIFDKLNILNSSSNTLLILWNKYQIFLYESLDFYKEPLLIVPEFTVFHVIISNNYLICLDCNENIHIIPLKFKNPAQKKLKSSSQPREQNIASCILYSQETTLSLKIEFESYFLCLHKINVEYKRCRKILLKNFDAEHCHKLKKSCLLRSHPVSEENTLTVKDTLKVKKDICENSSLIVISFDLMTVYGCIFHSNMSDDELDLVQLYSCPSEIRDIQIALNSSIEILIGLKSGTFINLPFTSGFKTPEIAHMNIPIYRFLPYKESLIYTDGITLWKSKRSFSQKEIELQEFIVQQTNDFLINGDEIIIVTYSNLVYQLLLEDKISFVQTTLSEYYSLENILNNIDYFNKIMKEVERSSDIIKEVNKESYSLTALALSKRRDLMDDVIRYKITVYDNYEDVLSESVELMLTNELNEYFEPESTIFMIKVESRESHKLTEVFTSLLSNLNLHISFTCEEKVVKTVTCKLTEVIKTLSIVIPFKIEDRTSLTINLQLTCVLPGCLDVGQPTWATLSEKNVTLKSEHFIKVNEPLNKNVVCLKKTKDTFEEIVLKSAVILNGPLFNINKVSKVNKNDKHFHFYLKLPKTFTEKISNRQNYNFNKAKTEFLLKKVVSQEFLNSKSSLSLQIGQERVRLEIFYQESANPLLKISGGNICVANDMRNFFSRMMYGDQADCEPNKEFIPQAQYSIVEDIQRHLRNSLAERTMDEDKIFNLAELFQKSVIGSLPL